MDGKVVDADAFIEALAHRLPARALRLLADADAFRSMALDRRQALWAVRRQGEAPLALFAATEARALGDEPEAALPAMADAEHIAADYQTMRLSLKGHPMAHLRPYFADRDTMPCAELANARDGRRVRLAGVVLVRQRPGKGNAIFITLEDESGIANLLLWARVFEQWRRPVMAARLLVAEGIVQLSREKDQTVAHLIVDRVEDCTRALDRLSGDHQPRADLSRADVFAHPQLPRERPQARRHPRDVRILPASRDFH